MVVPEVMKTVQRYLNTLHEYGVDVRFGVVFGSWARGQADRWSDIDLVIVSPQYDTEFGFEEVAVLWRIAAQVDSRIEPIPCGEKQWAEDDSSAIIEIARREGEPVATA